MGPYDYILRVLEIMRTSDIRAAERNILYNEERAYHTLTGNLGIRCIIPKNLRMASRLD